jgi:hypothetical protein
MVVLPELGFPANAIVNRCILCLHGLDHDVVGLIVAQRESKILEPERNRVLERRPADHFDLDTRDQPHISDPTAKLTFGGYRDYSTYSLERNLAQAKVTSHDNPLHEFANENRYH